MGRTNYAKGTFMDLINSLGSNKRNRISYSNPALQSGDDIINAQRLSDGTSLGKASVRILEAGILGDVGPTVEWPNKRLRKSWDNWSWSNTWGHYRFPELLAQVLRSVIVDGEVFIHKQQTDESQPMKIELIRALDLPTYEDVLGVGDRQQGIEFDNNGKVAYYHFRRASQDKRGLRPQRLGKTPARDVLHIFRPEKPNQIRGVSWLRAALPYLQDLQSLVDTHMGLIWDQYNFPGYMKLSDELWNAKNGWDSSTTKEEIAKALKSQLEIGGFSNLAVFQEGVEYVDTSIKDVVTPEEFKTMLETLFTLIARALDLQTGDLTSDISKANYSSYRHGESEAQRVFKRARAMLTNQFILPLAREWAKWEMVRTGVGQTIPEPKIHFPPFPFIDPLKEINAKQKELQSFTTSKSEVIKQSGRNPEDVFTEIAGDIAMLRDKLIEKDFEREEAMEIIKFNKTGEISTSEIMETLVSNQEEEAN